jgi:hypothetical protein
LNRNYPTCPYYPSCHSFPYYLTIRNFLRHLLIRVDPLLHHDLNCHLCQNYLLYRNYHWYPLNRNYHWFLLSLSYHLYPCYLSYHLYPCYQSFLMHLSIQAIPSLHHDHCYQRYRNYQMIR